MKNIESAESDKSQGGIKRRDFLKIPGFTIGILFGSVVLPPWIRVAFSATEGMPLKLSGHVRIGIGRLTLPLPAFIIRKIVKSGVKKADDKVKRFTPLKREIHHWVVKELPNRQTPITVQDIAAGLNQDIDKVSAIVDELEAEKTFLYRHNTEGINWAYPVTLESTPHHVTFDSGETVFAA